MMPEMLRKTSWDVYKKKIPCIYDSFSVKCRNLKLIGFYVNQNTVKTDSACLVQLHLIMRSSPVFNKSLALGWNQSFHSFVINTWLVITHSMCLDRFIKWHRSFITCYYTAHAWFTNRDRFSEWVSLCANILISGQGLTRLHTPYPDPRQWIDVLIYTATYL